MDRSRRRSESVPSCIYIVPRADKAPYAIYDRFAQQLEASFADIGLAVPIVRRRIDVRGRPLVLGAHRVITRPINLIPDGSICFNLEQLHARRTRELIEILKRYEVWDFSERNVQILSAAGHENARLCEFGYHAIQERIPLSAEDVDVLFYGNIRQRRRRVVLDALRGLGVRVEVVTSEFGDRLDREIARAKIILNVHRFRWCGLEMLRVGNLLANERFVVSERGADAALDRAVEDGLVLCDYEEIAATCIRYLGRPEERAEIARRGAERFRRRRQAEILRSVSGHLTVNHDGRRPLGVVREVEG